jgi:tetratricopeptide (TPR) repeat protein
MGKTQGDGINFKRQGQSIMLSRVKPRAAAERVKNDCSNDLLADLHLVVDDALAHGEIDKAHAYSLALMRVAQGESVGSLPFRFSGDKSISYRKAQRANRLAKIYAPLVIGAVLTISINHFSLAMATSSKLMDCGLVSPAMQVIRTEFAIEQLLNSPQAYTLGVLAYTLNCDGRFEEALSLANSTLSQYPIDGLVVRTKLTALSCTGRYEEAIATIKQTQPFLYAYDRDSLQVYAAESYTHLNDLPGAEKSWDLLPEYRKHDSQLARIVLGRIKLMQGDKEEAEKIFQQTLSRRGLPRVFRADRFRRAQVGYLQADLLKQLGNESRSQRVRSKIDKLVARDKLVLPPDPLRLFVVAQ